MTKEEVYRGQLEALGVYDPAFDPEIKTLAQLERRLTRAQKAWSETAEVGEKPSFLDPHYAVICQLERDVLSHREALGLTPKALRRIRGAYYETDRVGAKTEDADPDSGDAEEAANVLDFVRRKYGA